MTAGAGVPDTRTLITDDDVVNATAAATEPSGEGPWAHEVRSALEAVASGLRARWVAEALEEAAANPTATLWDDVTKRGVPAVSATDLRALAVEYRGGTR